MSLRDTIRKAATNGNESKRLFEKYGVVSNPFPASNQTYANPHHPIDADHEVETKIVTFLRDQRSQVVVVEGTQGVGKTNFLNYFETEIRAAMSTSKDYYLIRYLADPEASFEGTTRRLFEELGIEHLKRLSSELANDNSPIQEARGRDMQTALRHIAKARSGEILELMIQWLSGLRVLKAHREKLGIQFRLDTVESKTAAFRDMLQVSAKAKVLKGIFLLLDELEKQDGVLGPTGIVRYLSALRSIIDALPRYLFLMIGITPDALLRYSSALPALRSRLQNQITLPPLSNIDEALKLTEFYLTEARRSAHNDLGISGGKEYLISVDQAEDCFNELAELSERVGDVGVRQREYLHQLHSIAAQEIQRNEEI